jgi:hypothetical protein
MMVRGAGLERRQRFLFRLVDVAMELLALAATVCHADRLRRLGVEHAPAAAELADLFARGARRRIRRLFSELWQNEDARAYRVGRALLEGRYRWLEEGIVGIPYEAEELAPPPVSRILADRRRPAA